MGVQLQHMSNFSEDFLNAFSTGRDPQKESSRVEEMLELVSKRTISNKQSPEKVTKKSGSAFDFLPTFVIISAIIANFPF
jgi:hypothetical protein